MDAGFKQYPIGKLLDRGKPNSRVQFAAPPVGNRDATVQYHNMLVDLCQVGARRFADLLGAYAASNPEDQRARPPGSAADAQAPDDAQAHDAAGDGVAE